MTKINNSKGLYYTIAQGEALVMILLENMNTVYMFENILSSFFTPGERNYYPFSVIQSPEWIKNHGYPVILIHAGIKKVKSN